MKLKSKLNIAGAAKFALIASHEKSGIVVTEGFVDAEGNVQNTTVRVKLPEIGRIKVDEFGLYFDGNFNEGFDTVINNQ